MARQCMQLLLMGIPKSSSFWLRTTRPSTKGPITGRHHQILARLRGHKEALEYLLSKGGEALEQTEVCYRQDRFKGSGVSKDLKQGRIYDGDEGHDSEGDDVLSNYNGAMED